MRPRRIAIALTFLLTWHFLTGSASAQKIWIGGTASWFSNFTWSPAGPPDSFTDAWVNNGGTARIISANAQASSLYLGKSAGQSGAVQVSGVGGLTTGFDIYVGEGGSGALEISGGGDVISKSGIIGALTNSTGTATVSGAGSTWTTSSSAIVVGSSGAGTLTVESGGTVSSGIGVRDSIGFASTVSATATVTGPGSVWTNTSGLRVGVFGAGTLQIENGGVVNSGIVTMADQANSIGSVTVTGTDSAWNSGGDLQIGNLGEGMLTVSDGGAVRVGGGAGQVSINALSTLNIGQGGTAGAVQAGSITVGGILNFDHSDAVTFDTPISGTGQITKVNGAGDTTLPNVANFLGNVSVQGGLTTLQGDVKANDYLASGGGTLRFKEGVVQLGSSTILATSTGAIEYDGATVRGGFLRGPGTHTIVTGAPPSSFQSVTTFNSTNVIQNAPAFLLNFTNGGTFTNNDTLTFSGGLNAVTGTINVNAMLNLADIGNSGVISVGGTGVINNLVGNFVSGGGSRVTINTGGTINLQNGTSFDLNGGLLVNNGVINGAVNVNYGALAKGTGSYGIVNVNEGGVFAPGTSPGIATATSVAFDNRPLASGAPSLSIELGGTTAGVEYDQLHVSGALLLGGTLDVALLTGFAPEVGNSFDILDWGSIVGTFSAIHLPLLTGLSWNTSQLYTTGVLSVVAAPGVPGDYNNNGIVDAADYVLWRNNEGTTNPLANDPIGGTIGPAHFNQWRAHFGQTAGTGAATEVSRFASVPEPGTMSLLAMSALAILSGFRRRSPRILLGLAVTLACQLAGPAHAASLTATATGATQGPIDGLSIAEVTVGGVDPRIVAIHDNQEGNVGPVSVSADLSGVGSATYGRLSGEFTAQVKNNGPGNLNGVRAYGQVRLGFDETALVSSPTLPNGSPVTLTFRVDLASSAFLTPGASSFIDNGASTGFDARVTDLTTNQFAARFSGVSPTFVGPSSQTMTLDTQVGRTLRLFGELTAGASVRIDDNFTGMGITRTGAAAALSARLYHQVSGDVVLQSESGNSYALPAALLGDYNQNGTVDAADYALWRNNNGIGSSTSLPNDDTPGIGNDDYTRWRSRFGSTLGSGSALPDGLASVPEPTSLVLLLGFAVGLAVRRSTRQNRLHV